MKNKTETKQKILEALDIEGISNIDEATKFCYEKEGAEAVDEVNVKWEVHFEDSEPFRFSSDKELIEWCREQRDTYY